MGKQLMGWVITHDGFLCRPQIPVEQWQAHAHCMIAGFVSQPHEQCHVMKFRTTSSSFQNPPPHYLQCLPVCFGMHQTVLDPCQWCTRPMHA